MCTYQYKQLISIFLFFKQKTAYEMRMSDWSTDVCSSDLCKMLIFAQYMAQAHSFRPAPGSTQEQVFPRKQHQLGRREVRRVAFVAVEGVDRRSVVKGKNVQVSVDLGGSRCIKTNKHLYPKQSMLSLKSVR